MSTPIIYPYHRRAMLDHVSTNVLWREQVRQVEQQIIARMRAEAHQAARFKALVYDEKRHKPKVNHRP